MYNGGCFSWSPPILLHVNAPFIEECLTAANIYGNTRWGPLVCLWRKMTKPHKVPLTTSSQGLGSGPPCYYLVLEIYNRSLHFSGLKVLLRLDSVISKGLFLLSNSLISGLQPFWHQGLVLWKTAFPWRGLGDGLGVIQVHTFIVHLISIYLFIPLLCTLYIGLLW